MVTLVTAAPGSDVVLGSGTFVVQGASGDTIQAGTAGAFTVYGAIGSSPGTGEVIYGGGSPFTYVWQGGYDAATVVGGAGPLNVAAGFGGTYFGGSSGGNSFNAFQSTIFGAGSGDQVTGYRNLVVLGAGAETVNDVSVPNIRQSGGFNTVFGGSGADLIHLGYGGNVVVAGGGAETIFSGSLGAAINGPPTGLSGTGPASAVFLGSGADLLATGPEATFVEAGSGNGTILGAGATTGGQGDLYGFAAGHAGGTVEVHGFRPGVDALTLQGYAAGTAAAALAGAATVAGGSTVLTLPDATRITLYGVTGVGTGAFV